MPGTISPAKLLRRRRRSREGGGSSGGVLLRGRPPTADATDLDAEAAGSGRILLRRRKRLKGRGVAGRVMEEQQRGGSKPGIDARGVESMVAGGEEAKLVAGEEGGEADNTVKPLGSMATEEAREKRGRDSIRTAFSSSENTDESAMAEEERRWWMRGGIEEEEEDDNDDKGELTEEREMNRRKR